MTPFPSFFEIIRVTVHALGLRSVNKKQLDECVSRVDGDYRLINQFVDDDILKPLGRYVSSPFSRDLQILLDIALEDYKELIASVNCDGLQRSQVLSSLTKSWLVEHFIGIVAGLSEDYLLIDPRKLLTERKNAVTTVLDLLHEHTSSWGEYYAGISKEDQNRISSWRRGEFLPSSQSISLLNGLHNTELEEQPDWEGVKATLFIARAIESIKRLPGGLELMEACYECLTNRIRPIPVSLILAERQKESLFRVGESHSLMKRVLTGLKRNLVKKADDKKKIFYFLERAEQMLTQQGELETSIYLLNWMKARWFVFNGELDKANYLYKVALEKAIYRCGYQLPNLVQEALVVAASLSVDDRLKPDKAFLKRLKNVQVTFGIELPSVMMEGDKKPSNKFDEQVQRWEVSHWQANFNRVFPVNGFFPDCVINAVGLREGGINYSKDLKLEPDFSKPNKKIKLGSNNEKSTYQINWFVQQENKLAVKELLDRGARVDGLSDVDESPLTFALEMLSALLPRSRDEHFFRQIIERPEIKKVVNIPTQKIKLLPIIQAVETGIPWVVEELLKLGAKPDKKGMSDNVTALRVCISLIGASLRPTGWASSLQNHPLNMEALDGMRRQSNGQLGMDLDNYRSLYLNPEAKKIRDIAFDDLANKVSKCICYDDMHKILKLLLEAGANPNITYDTPVRGYTPLMLAAELNLRKEFELLLMKGGDPLKTFFHPGYKVDFNCWNIARSWNSKDVMHLLEDIAPNMLN